MKKKSIFAAFVGLTILLVSNHAHSQSNFWEQTNGPFGGNIQSLAINSNGDIFAGIVFGGMFRSTDNGDNWTAINTGLTNTRVHGALAINSNGDIFAGTIGGVFRSTDNGDNWTAIKPA